MKTRESGMPDEEMWTGFFSPEETLFALGVGEGCGDVVDFGCGYGTFAIPAARLSRGTVFALDIDLDMVEETAHKARLEGIDTLRADCRDFISSGCGRPDARAEVVLLFNILHCEYPVSLLREAFRMLSPGGRLAIMHWNYDPDTPRGPSMHIRPRPEECRDWALQAGFHLSLMEKINLPPYHYGWGCFRPSDALNPKPGNQSFHNRVSG